MIVTIFKTMSQHELPEYYPVVDILERIKRGDNLRLIEKIRSAKVETLRNQFKKQLLWVLFSGKFSHRHNDGMLQHSGVICLDFDKIPEKEMKMWRDTLQGHPNTFALFTSPSGNGLKMLVKVPPCGSNEEHNRRFDALATEFSGCAYFDTNVKGWARVCFDSYDPELYHNPDSEVFTGIVDPPAIAPRSGGTEITEVDVVFEKIVKWFEGKYNLNIGNRNQGAFIFASAVADYIESGQGEPMIENYIMGNVQQSDGDRFTITELRATIKSAYRHTPAPTKTMIDREPENNYDDTLADADEELPAQVRRVIFWTQKSKTTIDIDFLALKKFLQQNLYFRMDTSPKESIFVKVENNTIEEVSITHIKDFVLNTLLAWDEPAVFNMIAGHPKFKKEYLLILDPIKVQWMRDTRDESFIFYRNCTVHITRDKIDTLKYDQLTGYIWASQKLNRDFAPDTDVCDASEFVRNVCGNNHLRIKAYISAMGYLMHTHKNRSNARAVAFTDEIKKAEPTGGSGKGLTMKMIGQIRKVETFDGKNFDIGKTFALQRIGLDTQVVVIDDIAKTFDFERFFSLITEGVTIEKKNKDEFFIEYANSPKFAILTNIVLKGDSVSHQRRKFELELYPHYNEHHQPEDDFGRQLFEDWDEGEYRRFDNFMAKCIQFFLQKGLVIPEYVNLKIKKLERMTHEFFPEWARENLQAGKTYKRSVAMEAFREDNAIRDSYPRSIDFVKWMRYWAEYNGWKTVDCGQGNMSMRFEADGVEIVEEPADGMPF